MDIALDKSYKTGGEIALTPIKELKQRLVTVELAVVVILRWKTRAFPGSMQMREEIVQTLTISFPSSRSNRVSLAKFNCDKSYHKVVLYTVLGLGNKTINYRIVIDF